MGWTPFAELDGTLEELVDRARGILGENFVGRTCRDRLRSGTPTGTATSTSIVTRDELSDDEYERLAELHAEFPAREVSCARSIVRARTCLRKRCGGSIPSDGPSATSTMVLATFAPCDVDGVTVIDIGASWDDNDES
jgi:hypothetical protein